MSGAGVDPATWAGAFDCARCARARLPAIEFSKKALQRMRCGEPGTCKACVDAEAALERARATARARDDDDDADATCAACGTTKPAREFSKTQRRADGAAVRASASTPRRATPRRAAPRRWRRRWKRARVDAARVGATLGDHVRATNLEAEAVTGLRAKFVGGARGRGRGRGRSANPNSALGRGRAEVSAARCE